MPYITQEQRKTVDPAIDQLVEAVKKATVYTGTAFREVPPDGAINYAFTQVLRALVVVKPGYVNQERAVGILECCKLVLYRKSNAPYEDKKASENGEVYVDD
jgi:hypothetical protein